MTNSKQTLMMGDCIFHGLVRYMTEGGSYNALSYNPSVKNCDCMPHTNSASETFGWRAKATSRKVASTVSSHSIARGRCRTAGDQNRRDDDVQ